MYIYCRIGYKYLITLTHSYWCSIRDIRLLTSSITACSAPERNGLDNFKTLLFWLLSKMGFIPRMWFCDTVCLLCCFPVIGKAPTRWKVRKGGSLRIFLRSHRQNVCSAWFRKLKLTPNIDVPQNYNRIISHCQIVHVFYVINQWYIWLLI